MTVAIIGAGQIAQAIAGQLVRAGRSVVLSNSRGPDRIGISDLLKAKVLHSTR